VPPQCEGDLRKRFRISCQGGRSLQLCIPCAHTSPHGKLRCDGCGARGLVMLPVATDPSSLRSSDAAVFRAVMTLLLHPRHAAASQVYDSCRGALHSPAAPFSPENMASVLNKLSQAVYQYGVRDVTADSPAETNSVAFSPQANYTD
jgi:hypothetical protein